MAEVFDVIHSGQVVGRVEVWREGLYCRISCRCHVDDGKIHRLYADSEKIGILIPEGKELVLETKVAAKRLKEGCCYSLDENKGEFIPIRSGEAFDHLHKVRQGRLTFREEAPGLNLHIIEKRDCITK